MRRALPAVVGLAVLAVVAGLALDRDPPRPRTSSGWTPVLVPAPERPTAPRQPAVVTDHGTSIVLLPPATAPARVYPL